MSTTSRVLSAIERLNVDEHEAMLVCDRDIATCEDIVDRAQARWITHTEAIRTVDSCECSPTDPEAFSPACEVLLILWAARSYLELAKAGAPTTGAWPCKCGGSGIFRSGGGTVNGVFTGKTGTCFGCSGKGWCSAADRRRNTYYWAHARIAA